MAALILVGIGIGLSDTALRACPVTPSPDGRPCYLAYFASFEVSPRAMSENMASRFRIVPQHRGSNRGRRAGIRDRHGQGEPLVAGDLLHRQAERKHLEQRGVLSES